MSIFGKSYEEQLYEKIELLGDAKELNEQLNNDFWKYERLRQTWKFSQSQDKTKDLCYKVKKTGIISREDIDKAKKEAENLSANDPVYKLYFGVLENMNNLSSKISEKPRENLRFENIALINKKNLQDDMQQLLDISREVEESVKYQKNIPLITKKSIEPLIERFEKYVSYLVGVQNLIDKQSDKSMVENYRTRFSENKRILTAANELTEYFYGANNVIKKGAERFFKENKVLYDLIQKCTEKRYGKMLGKKNVGAQQAQNHYNILCRLRDVFTEASGTKEHKYSRKIEGLLSCYAKCF